MSSSFLSKWMCDFFHISSEHADNFALELDCLLSESMTDSEIAYRTRRFLEKRFGTNISEDKIVNVIANVKKTRTLSTLPVAWGSPVFLKSRPKFSAPIVCTPVITNGVQFSSVNTSAPTEVISPTVMQKSRPNHFTFDNKDIELSLLNESVDPRSPFKNFKRVDLVYSSIINKVADRLQKKVSHIADKDNVTEYEVYADMIQHQLRKNNHLKNKIDMLILRDEYEKLLSSCGISIDIKLKESIDDFIR